jgi:transposase
LYRQQQRFTREGIHIPYATLTDWVHNSCKLIEPLYEALRKQLIQSDYLHADETVCLEVTEEVTCC